VTTQWVCRSGTARRFARIGLLALCAAAWIVHSTAIAQLEADPDAVPLCNDPVAVGGQWSGPYDLHSQLNRGPDPPRYSEIAHAVLLPPPNAGWVLLSCARYEANLQPDPGPETRAYETFLWNPQNPGSVVRVPVPSAQPYGSDDFFCGGQVITPGGLVVVLAGPTSRLRRTAVCPSRRGMRRSGSSTTGRRST
jgi:hypothetical protein